MTIKQLAEYLGTDEYRAEKLAFDEKFNKLEAFTNKIGVIYSADGSMPFGSDKTQLGAIKDFIYQIYQEGWDECMRTSNSGRKIQRLTDKATKEVLINLLAYCYTDDPREIRHIIKEKILSLTPQEEK